MFSSFEGIDDAGWKAKLKLPPQDHRIKTSVCKISNECFVIKYINIKNMITGCYFN